MQESFRVEEFPDSINVAAQGSDLRIQIQIDPRYGTFVDRASVRDVLGLRLPVASIEDVLQGMIWAASHSERRGTKRRKDLLDIERILDANPKLRTLVPDEILLELS